MTYRTVLAYFGGETHAPQTLALASAVARRCEAHLIGLYVVPDIRLMGALAIQMPASVVETMKDHYRDQSERIRSSFEKVAAAQRIVGEYRMVEAGDAGNLWRILEHARTADLVVLAQADPTAEDFAYRELPDRVIMESGRPVLMAPLAGKIETVGDYAMVAWDGGREAARATFDALPLLRSAKQVYVHTVETSPQGGRQTTVPGSELSVALARHGVIAVAESSVSGDIPVGEHLRGRAADRGCDLLVMGGYGHSRLSEFVLGGTTRSILGKMTVPTLFSH